jgi:hypothetical protein
LKNQLWLKWFAWFQVEKTKIKTIYNLFYI